MRRWLVFLHRYVGLTIASFLVIAGLTGSVLAFEQAHPQVKIVSILPPAKQGDSVIVYVGSKTGSGALDYDQLFVDPASGRLLGKRLNGAFQPDRAHLIPFLYRLHYTLTLPGSSGGWLMGGVALAWMLDCFVGFLLTLPRGRPFWKKWTPIWTIKQGAGAYRLNLDLHRASGLWLWPVLFLLALSGVSLNLNSELFRPVLSALLPISPRIFDQPIPAKPPAMPLGWDDALAKARTEAARRRWDRPVALIYADRAHGFYMVRFGRNHEPGFCPSNIFVSGADGRIRSVEEAGGGKAGDMVARLTFPIHSGQLAGLPGRILICVTGLVIALLSITGVYIWWKKRIARLARRRFRDPHAPLSKAKIHAAE